jgi:hypothetical protein
METCSQSFGLLLKTLGIHFFLVNICKAQWIPREVRSSFEATEYSY